MSDSLPLLDNEKKLLEHIQDEKTPSYRQAYSDRTAWLMACLSELAYQPFNRLSEDVTKQRLQEKLNVFLNEKTRKALDEIIKSIFEKDNAEATNYFLKTANIEILKTYDTKGTQALLVSSQNYLALAFRGTEANSLQDIKTDMKAFITECPSGGKIHSGFTEAFGFVEQQILNDLNEFNAKEKPLFLTGHSLGGALATIAAKRLQPHYNIAACYTFGSPRLGNTKWFNGVKTPVYRIVNASDCVTMLPPAEDIMLLISCIFKLIFALISVAIPPLVNWLKNIQNKLKKFQGYWHYGDIRYLTPCQKANYEDVDLLAGQIARTKRLRMWTSSKNCFKGFVEDHSISVYRKKLAIIAMQRNS